MFDERRKTLTYWQTMRRVRVDVKVQLVICTVSALLVGSAVGRENPPGAGGVETAAAEESATSQDEGQEESWTWFGMGFETRRQRRGAEGGVFGPDRRPSGGFGRSTNGGRGGNSGRGGR